MDGDERGALKDAPLFPKIARRGDNAKTCNDLQGFSAVS